jgi:hypothetical protein
VLAEAAVDQFGLVTIDDAREVGYELKALVKVVGGGQLEPMTRTSMSALRAWRADRAGGVGGS